MRRIVKIAVRFLHTKTALCDRKDTQSRFAVNAARSIVCVETVTLLGTIPKSGVSMPHAALCVSRQAGRMGLEWKRSVFQCRTQHCVCRDGFREAYRGRFGMFQCRTQHCVCRDAVSRSPCPARAEKAFWKDETAECGFAPVPEHFPFPSLLIL